MTQIFFKPSKINQKPNEKGSKGAKMTVCGSKSFDSKTVTIKVLGVHCSYNQKLKTQKDFLKSITNMQIYGE